MDSIHAIAMFQELKKNRFTLWLLCAVGLAILWPSALDGSYQVAEFISKIGIWVIFFFLGISLTTKEIKNSYRPKRLHAFVLSWNFLLFPAIVALVLFPLTYFLSESLRLGFWLLAVLPTTVFSAVTFSTNSGGNSSNAICASVLSNLIAVLLVPPVAVAYFALEYDLIAPLWQLLSELFLLILIPLLFGQILRKFFPIRTIELSKHTQGLGNWVIVFIVYTAFSNSIRSGFFEQLTTNSIVAVFLVAAGLLLIVSLLVRVSSNWIGLARDQRISVFFCSSQKSLATGIPLATLIFNSMPGIADMATVLIPLMCYHLLQLILAGILSTRWALRIDLDSDVPA